MVEALIYRKSHSNSNIMVKIITHAHTSVHGHFLVSISSPGGRCSGRPDQQLQAAGGSNTNNHQPPASVLGRNMVLIVVVSSSSPQDPLWVIFICWQMHFYTFFFLAGLQLQVMSESPICIFTYVRYYFFDFFITCKISVMKPGLHLWFCFF